MDDLKIKIITGFSEDQKYTIPMEEAHKAYYLFLNPEKRGIFSNGLALIGKNIQAIQPDWNASMGWNPSHRIDSDDWNEINIKMKSKMDGIMEQARSISEGIIANPKLMGMSLSELLDGKIKLLL